MTSFEQRLKAVNDGQRKVRELALEIVDSEPWVPMKIGGKSYKFELSMGAVEDVFKQTDVTIGVDRITPQVILTHMSVLLLAGLRTHHSEEFGELGLTDEADAQCKIMRRLPIKHMNYYVTVIENALSATEPDPEQVATLMEAARAAVADMEEEADARPLEVVPISGPSGLSAVSLDSTETK